MSKYHAANIALFTFLAVLFIALVAGIYSLLALGVQYVWAWIEPSRPMPFWVAFVFVFVASAIFGAAGRTGGKS